MAASVTTKAAEIALTALATGRYLALLTATPSGTSPTLASLTEYAGPGYSRMPFTPLVTDAVVARGAVNSAAISTSPLTGANGTTKITHWALVTTVSGTSGDVLAYGEVNGTTGITPAAGNVITFAAGSIAIASTL